MEDVYRHIRTEMEFVLRDNTVDDSNLITPKKFTVKKISQLGKEALTFEKDREYVLNGIRVIQGMPGAGRVFFFPYSIQIGGETRFVEVKGYGRDGRDMTLFLHPDGDINFGMFFKNAAKEYSILEKAVQAGLCVPPPLLLGKIPREEWLKSALNEIKYLIDSYDIPTNGINLESLTVETDIKELGRQINNLQVFYFVDAVSAFKQPYNAGFLIRAPLSPFRIGDLEDKYKFNQRNVWIARTCGKTFWQLLDLGYFHLSPSTSNWTTQAELTDMSDCYDLRKDKNLVKIIKERENKTQQDFWEDLIDKRHTGNLSPYFIEGIFGEPISVEEAAVEIKNKVTSKLKKTL